MRHDPAFDEWIEKARRMPIARALDRVGGAHGISAKTRYVGPCPGCGGTDRFSLNLRKNIFWCRKSETGGDAIALASHVLGLEFLAAIEELTGEPPPGRATSEEDRAFRRKRVAEMEARRKAEAEQAGRDANQYREREIYKAHRIWTLAEKLEGSHAEAYLRHRGIEAGPGAKLRCIYGLPYWNWVGEERKIVHRGPAMVAAIQGRDGRFIGCHLTYIDPKLATASGKAEIVHPETGELLDAKKVRGSQKGGHIHLGVDEGAAAMVLGEGIETVLTVKAALRMAGDCRPLLWWSGVNLGNIGGKAKDSVAHPVATFTDARGHVRRRKVAGPEPVMDDPDCVRPPDGITETFLLGDGDSDHFATENVLKRYAARWAQQGHTTRAAWAEAGSDFNDMWRVRA